MGDQTDNYLARNEFEANERLKERLSSVRYTPRTERLARAALQASKALEASIEADSKWGAYLKDGTVVKFARKFDGSRTRYNYVAVRVAGYWYLTGKVSRRMSDDEFIEFVADARVRVATSWGKI